MSTDDTRPDLPSAKVCEHFYASHCYRGMSVRLCMLCHEPDWDDLAGQLDAARGSVVTAGVPAVTSPAPAPGESSGTATGPAEGDEAALGRVAKLAESWAALAIPGASGDVAAEVDAHCGRVLLDVIHGSSSADVRLSRVIAVAESWLAPGGPGLFYPAAGQAVLDAIQGASTEEAGGWRQRAERAEAQLAAVADFCKTSAGINYGLVKAGAILAITGTEGKTHDG